MSSKTVNLVTPSRIIDWGRRFFSLILAIYLLFLLGQAVYRNYRIKTRARQLQSEIAVLKAENERLNSLITYYQTDTFRELEARSKLGLKKPGETVIALPENSDEAPALLSTPASPSASLVKPNYIKWWEYLFGEQ